MAAIPEFLQKLLSSEIAQEPDSSLLDRFLRSRDQGAFAIIVQRHSSLVIRVCRGVLRNEADAEDASQATFLVLAQKARSVRKGGSLASWLHGVAMRVSLKLRAQASRRPTGFQETDRRDVRDPLAELTVREAEFILHEELQRLPSQYRSPLILCYLLGKTHDEAAATIGCGLDVFRGRLERARHYLHGRLLRRGLTLTSALLTSILVDPHAAIGGREAIVLARAASVSLPNAFANSLISSRVYYLTREVVRSMSFNLPKAGVVFALVAVLSAGIYSIARPVHPDRDATESTFHGKGEIIASHYNRFLKYSLEGGEPVPIGGVLGESEYIRSHRVSPDGKAVVFDYQTRQGIIHAFWEFGKPWPGKILKTTGISSYFWVPDGKHLLLSRYNKLKDSRPTEVEYYLFDGNTFARTELSLPEDHWPYDFSRDGKWFLTMKHASGSPFKNGELYRVESTAGQAQLLFSGVTWMTQGQWRISPDGSQIAGLTMTSSMELGGFQLLNHLQIFVGDLKNNNLRQVTKEESGAGWFGGWSPDGKKLLYATSDQAGKKAGEAFTVCLRVIDTDGRNRSVVARNECRLDENGRQREEDAIIWGEWR